MWKLFLALLLICTPAWAITNQWRGGVGTNELDGTQNAALIGYNSYNHIVQPLDNLLSNYCNEYLQYASSSTMTVVSGTCVVSNSQGTIRLFMQDTTNTTITSANLDTGSITASTTYYVYATAATNAATTSTYYISASNTAPSGQTYYYQIGKFSTDSSNQFTGIINNTWQTGYVSGTPGSKSSGVVYQALTDGWVTAYASHGTDVYTLILYSDSSSSPSTVMQKSGRTGSSSDTSYRTVGGFIRKGDYYEVTDSGGSATVNFIPIGK